MEFFGAFPGIFLFKEKRTAILSSELLKRMKASLQGI